MGTSLIPKCTTLIFDIGDVLFTWSPHTPTSITPGILRGIISSPTWAQYECGKLSQQECYDLVATEYAVDVEQIKSAFQHAQESLHPDDDFISFLRTLKSDANDNLRFFAMSNISRPDYEVLKKKPADWSIFEEVFTSAAVGMRKPDLCFYKHVLASTGSDPQSTVFVDDKPENVLSARSLGMHGIVFDNPETVRVTLRALIGDPIRRGRDYLDANAGQLDSVTNTGLVIGENFAQLLIFEVTNQRNLSNFVGHPQDGKWNFFRDTPTLTTAEFPFDFDTTSIGLTALGHDREVVHSVMNEMLQYRNEDGIIQTYFDHKRRRMDPVVCINVLSLFYSYDRGTELAATQRWVFDVLKHRAYLDGTRYYETAESFLYFLGRLLKMTANGDVHRLFPSLLKERLQERIGAPGDALALAMRIVACATVGIRDEIDLRRLLAMQHEDGSWGPGGVYKYGSSGISIGNRGLATALALEAIQAVESRE
ncbi:HAD-like domain-containing protein [Amylostereum chailletii]|nr:HAD-like domain-containing protein [Amylostereum chailletii]